MNVLSIRRLVRLSSLLLILILLSTSLPFVDAQADVIITVTSLMDNVADDGQCTLREAIISANTDSASGGSTGECVAGDTLTDSLDLSALSGDIILSSPLPTISTQLTILGDPNNMLSIRPDITNNGFGIFRIDDYAVTIENLTLIDGQAVSGGAIFNRGSLTLRNVALNNNSASSSGGAIFNNSGDVVIEGSSIIGNSAGSSGAGIFSINGFISLTDTSVQSNDAISSGGGVYTQSGTLTLIRSAISENTAGSSSGGGLAVDASIVELRNVTLNNNIAQSNGGAIFTLGGANIIANNITVAFNQASSGGGISNPNSGVNISNSVLGRNTSEDCFGTINSNGYNLFQATTCTITGDTTGNILGSDPLLAPFDSVSGTNALLEESPAIDTGNPNTPGSVSANLSTCEFADQLGVIRPLGLRCDIGAMESSFELSPPPIVPVDPLVNGTVIRGLVMNRDGSPLSNVDISVLHHLEIPPIRSHEDGTFSLEVTGGGLITLTYAKNGYLPAQRQVSAEWQNYAWVDDVVMIPLDEQVTEIDFTSSEPIQIVQGSVSTDDDGTRQATLLIPQGTTVELVMPDGTTQAVDTLNIRATEYTIGENGPEAMPGSLPANVAYTYALEYSADEAIASGATRVEFSEPIYHYSENFLNFSTGMAVPTGYYDREQAIWIPADNGRVVEVIAITSGIAQIDTTGDGLADNGIDIGLTEVERTQLSQLYTVGQSLWRVPIPHFTPWDCNWSFVPPDGAQPPQIPTPDPKPPLDQPDCQSGSVIECQNQILGENIEIVGTDFSLNYRSDRVPGRQTSYSLEIPLTDSTLPPNVQRIELEVLVAGQRFKYNFNPEFNLSTTFNWNSFDAYQREIIGARPALVNIGYVYNALYMEPADFSQAFGEISGIPLTANEAREEITLYQNSIAQVGTWDSRELGLGGWMFDEHHYYEQIGQTLYLGNGTRRSAQSLNFDTITTVVGRLGGSSDDDIPAVDAGLGLPADIEVGADGLLYIADSSDDKVRVVDLNGIISTIAGTGIPGFSGDGGPATLAQLDAPSGVAVAPDGTVYIVDGGNNRIRRVDANGIITTFAGNGTSTYCGDGGLAILACFTSIGDIVLDADGNLFVIDRRRIRRISPEGIITTFAGTGGQCLPTSGACGDGGPARQARFNVGLGLAIGVDGSVYLSEQLSGRIHRISPDGIIRSIAGNGSGCSDFDPCGDGGVATQASFERPQNIAITPDGTLYIADLGINRVRRITTDGIVTTVVGSGVACSAPTLPCDNGVPALQAPLTANSLAIGIDGSLYVGGSITTPTIRRVASSLPVFSSSPSIIASEDGDEVYIFDNNGQHLQTIHALTSAILYEFTYDNAGGLIQITDGDGNITTIQRDAGGQLTGIIGPYGQSTTLSVDANGFLTNVTDPLGQAYIMQYTSNGLLTQFTEPRGYDMIATYNEDGQLITHDDAISGSMELNRTDNETGYTTLLETGLDRVTTYAVTTDAQGNEMRETTLPSGVIEQYAENVDGSRSRTEGDGTTTDWVLSPDPRFGMLASVNSEQNIITPSGLTATVDEDRVVTLIDENDIFSLESQTETTTFNGRTYTTTYIAATNTINNTSPEGRQVSTVIDGQGRAVSDTVAGLAMISYSYDNRGRIETATQDGRTLTFTYNNEGYVETITDPIGRVSSFIYDAAGRVIQETLPGNRVVLYDYDANGNLISLTPPGQTAHTFSYTEIDQMASYTPPDIGIGNTQTSYSYDIDRDIQIETRPDARSIDYDYDTAGRLDAMTIARGVFTFAYDPTTGNLSNVTTPEGVNLAFAYDGFLFTDETWSGSIVGAVNRTYDNDFRMTSVSVNGIDPIAMSYDDDSLLISTGNLTISRDPQNGLLTGSTLGNLSDSYSYNTFGEMSNYDATYSGSDVYNVDYIRDDLGRISTLTETIGSVTTVYTYIYDIAGRLHQVLADSALIQTFTYDDNGNRLSLTDSSGTDTGTYDGQDRLLTYGVNTYAYTANGELLTRTNGTDVTTYDYDELSNLMGVDLPDGTQIDYLVDGANRRVGKLVNGTLTQGFLREDGLRIIAELDSTNTVVSRFVYGDSVNVPEYMIRGGITYRILTDHLGSIRLVVNIADGSIIQRMDYDAFGRVILDTNVGFQPFGFAGGMYDADTGLVRFGARDYDAEIGRWTTKDPIGFAGGDTNLYAYVANDPVNFVDSVGLRTYTIGGSIRVPSWIGKAVFGDSFIGQGGSAGVAISIPDALTGGEFDAGVYGSIEGGGTDYGVGRATIDLGVHNGSVSDLSGRGGRVSGQFGLFGGQLSFQGNSPTGLTLSIGAGYNLGGAGTITGTASLRDLLDPCR